MQMYIKSLLLQTYLKLASIWKQKQRFLTIANNFKLYLKNQIKLSKPGKNKTFRQNFVFFFFSLLNPNIIILTENYIKTPDLQIF